MIGGIMLSFAQPIRVGDLVIIEGHYAIVEEINLTYTVLKMWDWRRYVLPNNRLQQIDYVNLTLHDKWLWAYVSFWVSYEADVDRVRELAVGAVNASRAHAEGREPGFWVIEMNKEGLVCWVAGWVEHPLDAWGLRHDTAVNLVRAFKEHGLRAHVYTHETAPRASAAGMSGDGAPAPAPFVAA
jgi:small-conductance mechanosensitive channel